MSEQKKRARGPVFAEGAVSQSDMKGGNKMRNKLTDLNNHLFAQLERLGDESLTGDKLSEEISRAKAVTDVSTQIIANGSLVLKAKIAADNSLDTKFALPGMLEG